MPRFIQTIDSNGNKIINIPEINAGNQNSLNVVAEDTIISNSDKFEVDATTSILLTSNGAGEGKGIISVTAKQNLSAAGEGNTTVGSSASPTNINASTLNEKSTIQNIVTPTLNINNGASTTTLTSKSNITNTGTLENTGNVDVTGDTTLVGNLSIKSSSVDEGTVVTSSSVTFNNAEEILNKGKLTIAGDKSGSAYTVGEVESHENITNTGTIDNTGNVTVKNSTLKVEGESEGKSKSISITKDSIDSDTGATLFKNQTVNGTGTEYTYNGNTIVNFEGTTNLKGATTATANVTVTGANLTVTGNTTLTGDTTASGGTIELGDDTHTTTIKGSSLSLSVSSPASLEFSPSVKVSASIDGANPLVIEPGKISRTGSGNDLLIDTPNTTIKSGATSHIEGATVEVKDSTNSGGLTSSAGTTTLFGNSSVGISSSTGSVSLSSKTSMDLTGEGNVSVKSTGTGSSLNLGQAGNATNINGSKITLTHDSNNSVDVISKLTVKGSASGNGVEITDNLIKGAKTDGLKVESSNLEVQGNTSVSIKSPSITAGPISNNPSDNQVTINTSAKSLTVNNSTASIITSETTSVNAKQITLTSTGTGDAGKTVVNGGLKVTGGAEVDTLNATASLETPLGNVDTLNSTIGNITTINSDQANFTNQIKIKDLVIRYDSVAKALIFETAGA